MMERIYRMKDKGGDRIELRFCDAVQAIVISCEDDAVVHLTPTMAVALAERLNELAREYE